MFASAVAGAEKSPLQRVEPRVGTAPSTTVTAGMFGKNTEELGQTIPAVFSPHGMNFWTPQTRDTERKCIAPYYYNDSVFQGFRNSHWIVGGCTQDFGSMTLMPQFGTLRFSPSSRGIPFSHADEFVSPDYYRLSLPAEQITAEMTATSRAAIFRFTYDETGTAYLVVNPNSDEAQGWIAVDPEARMIYGYNPVHRIYQGKGESAGFAGYFVVLVDKPMTRAGVYAGEEIIPGSFAVGNLPAIGAYAEIKVEAGETVMAKAASSFVSISGALANLRAEIPQWSFDECRDALASRWNEYLGKIQVESDDDNALDMFYGAMYRCAFLPQVINDADGRYPAFSSGKIVELPQGRNGYYDGFSMWDTYRALQPLITLISPKLSGEMMQSLVDKYHQGGWLPIFPCWNSYTSAMIGDHCIAAISDASCKGVGNFNLADAYCGMRQNAFEFPSELEYRNGKGRRALESYLKYGYVPVEDGVEDAYHKNEQVSRTLEYAYDDFALAQVAKQLGHEEDYRELMKRAQNYRNVFDTVCGYVRARHADGRFVESWDPFSFSRHITEGAPCHYTWYVPHDPYGLIELMGGTDSFLCRLDSMFTQNRYWHGNEPCHQVAFMFNYAGRPDLTQKYARHILATEYANSPGGLAGNDDAGQMSAWYLFASLGFYPVCPSTPYYIIASPTFKRAVLNLENGNSFIIEAPEASDVNIYIQRATLNGKDFNRNYLSHDEITQGGVLHFEMGPQPSLWGTRQADCPPDFFSNN